MRAASSASAARNVRVGPGGGYVQAAENGSETEGEGSDEAE